MTEADRLARNAARLQDIYGGANTRRKFQVVLLDLEGHGFRPRIQEAWRSRARQLLLRALGRTKVTYGYHNVTGPQGQPEALAMDVVDDDNPTQADAVRDTLFAVMLARSAKVHGLETGIMWGLDAAQQHVMELLLRSGMVSRLRPDGGGALGALPGVMGKTCIALGWDSLHVQVRQSVLPLDEAKAGKRPLL